MDGLAVEVVDDPSFTAWCRTLYLLLGAADFDGVDGGTVYDRVLEDGLAGGLVQRDMRTAEGPSCAAVHVDLDAQRTGNVLDRLQGLHPFGRQEGDVVFVVALHAVERSYLNGSNASAGIFREVPLQVLLIDGRPQPPPARAGLSLRAGSGPGLRPYGAK